MSKSRVWTTIDFDRNGVQSGHAYVPYSPDHSAYGMIPVPMICIKGGEGPTALFIAGNHGDEYEGQVALLKLARELAGKTVSGRIIILPALNRPAVMAGKRNSPLDNGNMNRVFPGRADGGPTEMIAHYVSSVLFPLSDLIIDLHSGGFSLDHLPLALARPGRTQDETAAIRKLLASFAAPVGMVTTGVGGGAGSTLYAAAEAVGIPALTTELGSGVTLSPEGLKIAETGLRRVLRDYGIVPDYDLPEAAPTILMRSLGPQMSIYAAHAGHFEPSVRPGEVVEAGQIAGWLHHLDDVMAKPTELVFNATGMVAWRRFPTLSAPGDGLFGLMAEIDA